MEAENKENLIDLSVLAGRFRRELRRFWLPALVLALLIAGALFMRSYLGFTPMYEAKAIFAVSSGYSSDDILSYSSYYDSDAAKKLASAFPYVQNTDLMRELIVQELGTGSINASISAKSVAETNLFVLQVRSADAQNAYDVLNAVIECYPKVLNYMSDFSQLILKDEPSVPTQPYNSFAFERTLAKDCAVGALISLIGILALALSRRTFNGSDELKAYTNLPIYAAIPAVSVKRRSRENCSPSILSGGSNNGFSESIHGLRTKLLRHMNVGRSGVIMVTSTIAGEGKTTISENLAMSIATAGYRTVLVDVDLKKQDIKASLGISDGRPGLPEYLKGNVTDVSACLSDVPGSTLKLICSENGANARAFLSPSKLGEFLEELEKQFDYIVLDTPPCGIISHVRYAGRFADAVLYVVRSDFAKRSQVLDSMQALDNQHIKISGCVLNGVEGSSASLSYGYGYVKYGYGKYGYGRYGYGKQKSDTAPKEQ